MSFLSFRLFELRCVCAILYCCSRRACSPRPHFVPVIPSRSVSCALCDRNYGLSWLLFVMFYRSSYLSLFLTLMHTADISSHSTRWHQMGLQMASSSSLAQMDWRKSVQRPHLERSAKMIRRLLWRPRMWRNCTLCKRKRRQLHPRLRILQLPGAAPQERTWVKRIAKSNRCNPSGTDALLLLPLLHGQIYSWGTKWAWQVLNVLISSMLWWALSLSSASLASLTRESGPQVIKGDPSRKRSPPKSVGPPRLDMSDSALKFTHVLYNLSPAGMCSHLQVLFKSDWPIWVHELCLFCLQYIHVLWNVLKCTSLKSISTYPFDLLSAGLTVLSCACYIISRPSPVSLTSESPFSSCYQTVWFKKGFMLLVYDLTYFLVAACFNMWQFSCV